MVVPPAGDGVLVPSGGYWANITGRGVYEAFEATGGHKQRRDGPEGRLPVGGNRRQHKERGGQRRWSPHTRAAAGHNTNHPRAAGLTGGWCLAMRLVRAN